jgi:hypothetical protein
LVVLFGGVGVSEAARGKPPVPDLTKGGQKDSKHDWNLGPTGLRGWIWGWKLETTDSRQVLVTKVDAGSPADGVFQVGDVILGVGGKPFADDARKSFGRAITEAEKRESKGVLKLIRWRKGTRANVQIKLAVLGSYSDTSPFGCPKSRKILNAACRRIARRLKGGIDGKINALALRPPGRPGRPQAQTARRQRDGVVGVGLQQPVPDGVLPGDGRQVRAAGDPGVFGEHRQRAERRGLVGPRHGVAAAQ